MKKKISVCMATFNGEKYVYDQINSILKQIDITDELVISDDGSTDNTLEIIKSINDSRIRLVYNSLERGYTKNFENALNNATGDIFFLSDQDDVWLEGRVKKCIDELQLYDFVMTDGYITDAELNKEPITHFEKYNVKQGFWYNFIKTRYVGAFMAFNSDVYKSILPFPENQDKCPHDYWITLVAEKKFKTKLIKIPLVLYRRHDSNLTGNGSRALKKKAIQRIYTYNQLRAKR